MIPQPNQQQVLNPTAVLSVLHRANRKLGETSKTKEDVERLIEEIETHFLTPYVTKSVMTDVERMLEEEAKANATQENN